MRSKSLLRFAVVVIILSLGILSFLSKEPAPGIAVNKSNSEMAGFTETTSADFFATPSEATVVVREDTNVRLTVDTENITEENHDETVAISDDRSDPSEVSGKPSEHVTWVDKNMKIYWSAEPLDSQTGTTVDVLGIFRKTEGGAEILEAVFRDPNRDGIVMGKIKNKKVEGIEYYNILIRVNGETSQTYLIDPKLKMSTD
jgi:hypothetical protein